MRGNFRARVDPNHPEAFAICDQCGFLRNHCDLAKDMEWRGNNLVWTGFLVCQDTCLDVPYEFDRPIKMPPDPEPVVNARPNMWAQQSGQPPANIPVQQLIEGDD